MSWLTVIQYLSDYPDQQMHRSINFPTVQWPDRPMARPQLPDREMTWSKIVHTKQCPDRPIARPTIDPTDQWSDRQWFGQPLTRPTLSRPTMPKPTNVPTDQCSDRPMCRPTIVMTNQCVDRTNIWPTIVPTDNAPTDDLPARCLFSTSFPPSLITLLIGLVCRIMLLTSQSGDEWSAIKITAFKSRCGVKCDWIGFLL